MAIPAFLATASQPLLVSPLALEAAAPKPKILRVRVQEQRQTNWCWAAVSVGIARAYGTPGKTQCGLASVFLAPAKCCPPRTAACDHPFDLEKPLAPHHLTTHALAGHRTFAFVKKEIDDGNPVAVRIDRNHGGSGHAVVISGYLEDAPGATSGHFWICDPEYGDRQPWRFEHFRDQFEQDGVWDLSYETTGSHPVPVE